jgi:hypothetical protein
LGKEPARFCKLLKTNKKKQGAAGITTAAPRIAGQWGRGDNRLRDDAQARKSFPPPTNIFRHG